MVTNNEEQHKHFIKLHASKKIDRRKDIKYPTPLFSVGEKTVGQTVYPVPFATFGNFSAIQGGSKVGKTYFKSLLIASYIGGNTNNYAPNIKSHRTTEKEILDFDTEQGEWHASSGAKRVDTLVGDYYGNYHSFQLRELDAHERVEFIEYCLFTKYKDIGLVVIDGIADLVSDVNSLEESNHIIQKLMEWSSVLDIHIMVFIHTNWGSDKATGHLGSAIGKKAETLCDLKRDQEFTNVKFLFCRGFKIDDFRFRLDDNGLPITEDEMLY